jgi:hypothetical protein
MSRQAPLELRDQECQIYRGVHRNKRTQNSKPGGFDLFYCEADALSHLGKT